MQSKCPLLNFSQEIKVIIYENGQCSLKYPLSYINNDFVTGNIMGPPLLATEPFLSTEVAHFISSKFMQLSYLYFCCCSCTFENEQHFNEWTTLNCQSILWCGRFPNYFHQYIIKYTTLWEYKTQWSHWRKNQSTLLSGDCNQGVGICKHGYQQSKRLADISGGIAHTSHQHRVAI